MRFVPRFWHGVVAAILSERDRYGRADIGKGERINVEFVSANPTGPMHVGHCRGAVFGDSLVNLLRFTGYDVTAEYYINDAGAQVDALARSAYLRYREALGEDIGEIPPGLYPGDYVKPVGAALAKARTRQGKSAKSTATAVKERPPRRRRRLWRPLVLGAGALLLAAGVAVWFLAMMPPHAAGPARGAPALRRRAAPHRGAAGGSARRHHVGRRDPGPGRLPRGDRSQAHC